MFYDSTPQYCAENCGENYRANNPFKIEEYPMAPIKKLSKPTA